MDEFPELTQDQFVTLFTNGSVRHTVQGQTIPMTVPSETIELTEMQAEIIVEALAQSNLNINYAIDETARQTQEELRTRFELDEGESLLEMDDGDQP